MRKVILISFLSLFVTGCSVTRNLYKGLSDNPNKPIPGNIAENIENQNITSTGFFIQKADIEMTSSNGKDKFIGTIKFQKPDKYLVSIRTRTGIEGARIFISGDSVLINDRINKKMYSGTSVNLMKKYGISQYFLPVVFGDIILDKHCGEGAEKCDGNNFKIECIVKGVALKYNIDCKRRKVIAVDQGNGNSADVIKINFNSFQNIGSKLIPGFIELNDPQHDIKIKMKLSKILLPWDGVINFIPGKGYEIIELV